MTATITEPHGRVTRITMASIAETVEERKAAEKAALRLIWKMIDNGSERGRSLPGSDVTWSFSVDEAP